MSRCVLFWVTERPIEGCALHLEVAKTIRSMNRDGWRTLFRYEAFPHSYCSHHEFSCTPNNFHLLFEIRAVVAYSGSDSSSEGRETSSSSSCFLLREDMVCGGDKSEKQGQLNLTKMELRSYKHAPRVGKVVRDGG